MRTLSPAFAAAAASVFERGLVLLAVLQTIERSEDGGPILRAMIDGRCRISHYKFRPNSISKLGLRTTADLHQPQPFRATAAVYRCGPHSVAGQIQTAKH